MKPCVVAHNCHPVSNYDHVLTSIILQQLFHVCLQVSHMYLFL